MGFANNCSERERDKKQVTTVPEETKLKTAHTTKDKR